MTPETLKKISKVIFNVTPAVQFDPSTIKDDPVCGHIARALGTCLALEKSALIETQRHLKIREGLRLHIDELDALLATLASEATFHPPIFFPSAAKGSDPAGRFKTLNEEARQ